ncbi:TIGR04028 family ABC transporter substrate-binding protein [Aestuariimicrobium ganziense]|uniref:TIGR04028 family ABC transporter substrate-binding protein n=1 Tax=Aestuariimicrobium ganziense TaxID=2773677 RepID=UPI0019441BE8|nr:TIGR04028 family ABC transporter substrate-binding protein [Aestuariimicrobium ganziense]
MTLAHRHLSRRNLFGLGIAAASLTALTACGGGAQANNQTEAPAGDPVKGGTLTYLDAQPHTSLYPPSAGFYPNGGLVNNITDRLVHQNAETLEFEPWIATEWTVNDDATEFTFTLRDDVTFSDGTKLDAAAVAKNFDLYGLGDAARGLTVSEAINNYKSSTVVNPTTVTFHFSAPAPGFLQATSTINSGLLSPKTLDGKLEDFGAGKGPTIIGTGPFVVASEKIGSEVVLKARTDYAWAPKSAPNQSRAHLDQITYVVTPEAGVRVGGLTSGQAHIARQIAATDEKQVTAAGAKLLAPQTRGVNNGFSLRFRNEVLADKNVRQALSLGTNRQEVVDTLFTENYPLATSVIGKTALGYQDNSSKLVHDPGKGAQLLEDAGWKLGSDGYRTKDGKRLTFTVNEAAPQPRSFDVTTLVSQQWKAALGVELKILRADAGTYTKAINDANQVQVYHSMVGRADLDVIKSQYAGKNRNTLLNRDPADDSIGDTKLEELLTKVASTPDHDARIKASQDVQAYLLDEFYVIPLFEEPQVFGLGPKVHGFEAESVGRPTFHNTWVAE